MVIVGALCVVAAAVAGCSAARRDSDVQRRLALLGPAVRRDPRWRPVRDRDLRQAGLARTQTELVAVKLVGALAGATAGAIVAGPLGASAMGAAIAAYAGWAAPSIVVERRAGRRREEAERAMGPFIERLEALTASGRPVEMALAILARAPSAAPVLDTALRRAADGYALGAPLFPSLHGAARAEALDGLATLAATLERSRGLGRGSRAAIRDARESARAAERARSLEAAGKVEGKLMLTLVLCYLPALMLLVVIPLFLTLLDGLFG